MGREQLNVRLDDFYSELLQLMIEKEKETQKSDKTKITKSALLFYAHHLLDDDTILNLQLKHMGRF